MEGPLQPKDCAKVLKALADPERLRIVDCLRKGPSNVSDLAAQLTAQVVNISHHLGVLKHANIVEDEKQGRFVIYRLHPGIFRPGPKSSESDMFDLGSCRVELPRSKNTQ